MIDGMAQMIYEEVVKETRKKEVPCFVINAGHVRG